MSASMARISHRATATLTSRTTPAARQGPGKVAIRPVYPMTPHRGPAPRDCVGPGREPDSSDRHGRTYGADRDFAGALPTNTPDGETFTLLNPRIIEESLDGDEKYEGCLSFFDVRGLAGSRQSRDSSRLSDDPTSWSGTTRLRWSRPGARFKRQAWSDIWCRPRLCRGPGSPPNLAGIAATAPAGARARARPGLGRAPRCGSAAASQASLAGTSSTCRVGAWPRGPAPSGPAWRRSAPPRPGRTRSLAGRPAGRPRTRRTPPP